MKESCVYLCFLLLFIYLFIYLVHPFHIMRVCVEIKYGNGRCEGTRWGECSSFWFNLPVKIFVMMKIHFRSIWYKNNKLCAQKMVRGVHISWRFYGSPCMGELFFCLIPLKVTLQWIPFYTKYLTSKSRVNRTQGGKKKNTIHKY